MKCLRTGCNRPTEGKSKLCYLHKPRKKRIIKRKAKKTPAVSPAVLLATALSKVISSLVRQELKNILNEDFK